MTYNRLKKVLGFGGLHFDKELCVNVWYTLTMDLSMSIIDDDYELDSILERILESTNLDEHELIDLSEEQRAWWLVAQAYERWNGSHFGYWKC